MPKRKVGENLKRKYAVIDLETTDSKFEDGGRIFQFGCSIIEKGVVVSETEILINPGQDIPYRIQLLTGIKNSDVRSAPYFEEVAGSISQLLSDAVIIAHNVTFDYPFLVKSLEELAGIEWSASCIDTVQLAHICLPTADSYRLSDLSQLLGIEHHQAHSAGSDASATAQLFLALVKRLETLPLRTLKQLRLFSDSLLAETGMIFADILSRKKRNKPAMEQTSYQILDGLALSATVLEENQQALETPRINAEEAYQKLVQKGLIQFDERQVLMIRDLLSAFHEKKKLHFLQAEPGSGKTVAYLLASLEFLNSQQPIWIATSTLLLQQQLVEQEWLPLLRELEIKVPFITIKGKQHYVSLSGVQQLLQSSQEYQTMKSSLTIMGILVWLTQTQTGDLTECNQVLYHYDLWPLLSSKTKDSSFDFYQRAVSQAQEMPLVITNQAYSVAYLQQSKEKIRKPILLVDEVHQLEATLEQSGHRIFQFNRFWELQTLWSDYHIENYLEMNSHAEHQSRKINRILLEICDLYEEWLQIVRKESYPTSSILLTVQEWKRSIHRQTLQAFQKACVQLLNLCQNFKGDEQIASYTHQQLVGLVDELVALGQVADGFVALTLEVYRQQQYLQLEVVVSTQSYFANYQKQLQQLIGVSATIPQYSPLFYGLVRDDSVTIMEQRPRLMEHEGFIPTDLPTPTITVTPEATQQTAEIIQKIYHHQQGRMLVLVHSIEMLEALEKELLSYAEDHQVELLVQRSQQSSRKIQRKFQTEERVILLGVYSFWEGFDSGEVSIDQLVITKLPFPNPASLQQQVIAATVQQQGRQYFNDYALPKMLQQLYQGLGRMNRPFQKPAEIWLLDSRASNGSYASQVKQVFPKTMVLHEKPVKKLLRRFI